MNFHYARPDRSPEAIARRRKAADQAISANKRQGYIFDPVLEDATEAYVVGEITREEYHSLVIEKPRTI